jgi:hypothetical protein
MYSDKKKNNKDFPENSIICPATSSDSASA